MDPERLRQLLEAVRKGEIPVDEAIEEIRRLPYVDLEFAKVDVHRSLRCGFPEVIFCAGKRPEHVAEIARAGERQMEAFCDKHLSGFPNYETRVVTGSPGDEILKFIEKQGIELVIMGTHGRKGLDRTLMGSVADDIIKNAAVPVMTINPFRPKA